MAKGVQKLNDVLEKAVATKDEQFHEILDPYKDQPFNAKASADRVRQAATQYEEWGSPQLAASLRDVASRLENVKSIKDADGMRKVLNDLSAKIYNAPASQITDLMAADANRRAADIIRGDLYDTVADLGGIDPAEIRKIQKLHGDTIAYRDAYQNRIHGLGPAESEFQGTSAAKRILRGRSEESSVSMGKMVKRAFEPSDYGKVNAEAQKLFKNLGEGGTRDSFNPVSRGGSVEVTPSTRQKQLPPITGAVAETPGNPEVTGGVFPQREGGRRTVRTRGPFNADNPHLTAYEDHPNQPFYVTDYVGSGKGGETPAMPGTAKAIVHIDTPEAAKSALKGYDRFKNSSAYDKLDVDAKNRFDQQHQRLQAFAKQGKVGAPRNQPGPTVTATPKYGLPKLNKTSGTAPTRMRTRAGLKPIARALPSVAVDSKYEDDDDSHR